MGYPQPLRATHSSHRHTHSRASEGSAGLSVALIQWQQPSLQSRQHRHLQLAVTCFGNAGALPPCCTKQSPPSGQALGKALLRCFLCSQQLPGWVKYLLSAQVAHESRAVTCREKAASDRQCRVSKLGQPALLQGLQGT